MADLIPLVTGPRYVEQIRSTQDIVTAVYEDASRWAAARGEGANASPVWLEFKRWVNQWGHFAEAQRMPPLLPLPPPLPSIFVRPAAWRQAQRWDEQARSWARRWSRAGATIAELPPPLDPPPALDPEMLGLGATTSFGAGVLVGLLAGAVIVRRLT